MNRSTPDLAFRVRLVRILRIAGAFLALATAGFWWAKGAHTGWTQHRVPSKQVDEVTGLEFITYEDRYVPGVEVLAVGLAVGATLFAASFLFRKRNH